MPITDLDFDLAACPAVGPECRLCYSDITSLVSRVIIHSWQHVRVSLGVVFGSKVT
jgi:hypothetical protein